MLLLPLHVFAGAHQITQWANNKAGAVSITFDDGHTSHYTLAAPALNEKGFKGSFFIITDWVDNNANWDEWRDVSNQGHEIGSHTKTHVQLTLLARNEIEEEIEESKAIIDGQITTQRCLTFVYPFGSYDDNAKALAENYYSAARGISCDLNTSPYNFYGLRACGDSRSLEQMKAMADAAEDQGEWLITFLHKLDGTEYWTLNMFIAYLDYLQTRDLWVSDVRICCEIYQGEGIGKPFSYFKL